MRKLPLILALSLLLGSALAQEPPGTRTKAEDEVWNREETYWQTIMARDKTGYLQLWDDSFVGWPFYQKSPIDKSAFQAQPFGITKRLVSAYRIEQKSVTLHGETAVTYLQVHITQTLDGQRSEPVIRMTHVWQQREGVWRIVGGMSCVVNPDGQC